MCHRGRRSKTRRNGLVSYIVLQEMFQVRISKGLGRREVIFVSKTQRINLIPHPIPGMTVLHMVRGSLSLARDLLH